jgi:gamma-glutamylcyclotransferase (GGCT)/AIG2-like uncharacterized protein YtfP
VNDKVFVYGTLLIPAVMEAVTGKSFESTEAVLQGYARYRLKGRIYPGITKVPNRSVDGCVYHGIDNPVLGLIDAFEADEYQRVRVTVTGTDGVLISANTYVITPAHSTLLTRQDWDLDGFVKKHLESYLQGLGVRS